MTGLGAGLDATANQATRDRRQELGLAAAFALHSIVRNARLHDERNEIFDAPIEQLQRALAELAETDGALDLQFSDQGISANRQQLRVDATGAAVMALLKAELTARGIHGLSAAVAPDATELRALARLFTTAAPRELSARGDPAQPLSVLTLALQRAGAEGLNGRGYDTRLVDSYAHAVWFVDRTIAQLRAGAQSIPAWAASRVVQDLVELQREAPLRFLQLARTKAGGAAYWGYHGANVAVLAISFGARLGMDKRRRHDLGMGALFHDIGIAALPVALLQKEEALTDREVAALRSASIFGARAILRQREVHPAALERGVAAVECHGDTSGGLAGRILAICEAYDALTTTRPQRRSLSHHDALRVLRTDPAHRFDLRLVELFTAVVDPLV
jgi:HD-GYP domain-containing protein (c-di-GMP phosphodiesterase class II)